MVYISSNALSTTVPAKSKKLISLSEYVKLIIVILLIETFSEGIFSSYANTRTLTSSIHNYIY